MSEPGGAGGRNGTRVPPGRPAHRTSQRPGSGPGSGRSLIPIGRFFGVPLYLAPSWLVIAAVITIGYADLVRENVTGLSQSLSYLVAFGYAVALAVCVLLHELGHTAVSLRLGNPVERVVIFLLGGVSEIGREPARPRDEFLVSVSGPLVSAALGGAAFGGVVGFDQGSVAWLLCALLAYSNFVIAAFNLLPGLPLDGGRVLRSIVWALTRSAPVATKAAAWCGRGIAVALVVAFGVVAGGRFNITTTLVTALLAVFIWSGATQELRAAQLAERLPRLSLPRLLRRGVLVAGDTPVAMAMRQAWDAHANALVVVDSTDQPYAIVEESRVINLPPAQQPWVTVAALARPIQPDTRLPIDLQGQELLDAVKAAPAPEYLVVDRAGQPAGILSARDLAAALSARP